MNLDPRARITVKGHDLPMEDLIAVSVQDKIEENDEFQFTVYNRNRKYKGAFERAQDIGIYFGYGNSTKKLIRGKTDETLYSGSKNQGEIVTVMGTSIAMEKSQTAQNKTYENMSFLQIAQDVCKKHGLKLEDFTKTAMKEFSSQDQAAELKHFHVTMLAQAGLGFLSDLATEIGLELQVKQEKVIVRAPASETSPPVAVFAWGEPNLISYQVREKTKEIYQKADVYDDDPVNKKTMHESILTDVKDLGSELINVLTTNLPAQDQRDLRIQGESILQRKNREEKTLYLVVVGQNYYRAGACIKIANIEHDGTYYIRPTVTHTYSKNEGYRCQIEASNKR